MNRNLSLNHFQDPKHHSRIDEVQARVALQCPACAITLPDQSSWLQHASDRHPGEHIIPEIPGKPNEKLGYCTVCNNRFPMDSWNNHLSGTYHIRTQLIVLWRTEYEQETALREVATMSHPEGLDFGLVDLEHASTTQDSRVVLMVPKTAGLVIRKIAAYPNAGNNKPSKSYVFSFTVSWPLQEDTLTPLEPVEITVHFNPNHRGKFAEVLAIDLESTTGPIQGTFRVRRKLMAMVGRAEDHKLLQASKKFVKQKRTRWRHGGATVEGERPPEAVDSAPWVQSLPKACVPKALSDLLSKGATRTVLQQLEEMYFANELSLETHLDHFTHLLWAEEARIIDDLRMYDMRSVKFRRESGRLHTVNVPGLAEKRPSVVVGDIILAQALRKADSTGPTHRGFVHIVRNEDICVSFHSSFDGASRYNIRFEYNRIPLRRQHQALSVPSLSAQRLLFPHLDDQGILSTPQPDNITTFNPLVALNSAQLQAVKLIVSLQPVAPPFVIFGPPGTGKTITLVESIRQVLHRDPTTKVLACAPSNSAADLIAQRLSVALTPNDMFRCNAIHRIQRLLPADLVPYSLFRGHLFALPSLEQLCSYRVIVSTCGNASFPYNVGMPTGHFSHIFVDEAGQASEPEVLQAIKIISSADTRVVLAGDPKQLGPVIRSSIARHFGLAKSYLERIMEQSVYTSAMAPNRAFVKLVKNFRSHEAILQYPNNQFYDGDLEACADPEATDAFLGSAQLVNLRFPVVFQHVSGENEREASSPSYFNILEATETVERIKLVLRDAAHPVRPEDIAVITPYYAQARKIRMLLKTSKIEGVTVCSVEQIQGQERPVIFISTVRSSRDLLSYDAKFTLGFVSNPRRFNVAVTRAKGLLVVIGDSDVLSIDPVWRGFLNYVHQHGGWSGDEPGWDTSAPVDANFDYAAEIREAAANDMDALIARLAEGHDVEAEANVERPFVEED
ncbi:P-loop containing nucleoside triphosphate hydrolase protein [Epithele typhae]|uniref:P-loop containing nucleoside triphosphate hydrolase protein n=1 Tax=Epithele typhae TaxID=378194 RepID=UPI0020072B24|nr:P-loop containing nucleoside triphosphate hydrolase protein [Epithele typhae]KAH9930534.1 P-loop containing nucleoside triphosphate hydrolase protein [Epithele typhae]